MTDVQAQICAFEKRFNRLKKSTRNWLNKHGISVQKVVGALMSLPAHKANEHIVFPESYCSALLQSQDYWEVIGWANTYWNYLVFHLLEYLITKFTLVEVQEEMQQYKADVHKFMNDTPLILFSQAQTNRHDEPLPGFKKIVMKHVWPKETTLIAVETFRQDFTSHYNLHEYAMMFVCLSTCASTVTWLVPKSITEYLVGKGADKVFDEYNVTKVNIAGAGIYYKCKSTDVSSPNFIFCLTCTCTFIINFCRHPSLLRQEPLCHQCHTSLPFSRLYVYSRYQ